MKSCIIFQQHVNNVNVFRKNPVFSKYTKLSSYIKVQLNCIIPTLRVGFRVVEHSHPKLSKFGCNRRNQYF